MKTHLLWFTQDLRLTDNATLLAASHCDRLICVYFSAQNAHSQPAPFSAKAGEHRQRFVRQALADLQQRLNELGQSLLVLDGPAETQIPALVATYQVAAVFVSRQFGLNELRTINHVRHQIAPVVVYHCNTYTLFSPSTLPMAVEELPDTYSGFRRKAETQSIKLPQSAPTRLPPSPFSSASHVCDTTSIDANPAVTGGESAALDHCQRVFDSALPKHYKTVRNALDGWENSSKFSLWLATGCISARQLKACIDRYQHTHGPSESVYWLFVELLWREYFQWRALQIGIRLFQFQGTAKSRPLTSFYPERLAKWQQGTTPWPLVNACMLQLRQTGYLSNRGRQIVASCLINELQLDWRYGAAWFEQCLIDYDVAVNWGNWQYIAGVGADPRGGRHFDLAKQTETFDPDGEYVQRWLGLRASHAIEQLDSVNAADWPVTHAVTDMQT